MLFHIFDKWTMSKLHTIFCRSLFLINISADDHDLHRRDKSCWRQSNTKSVLYVNVVSVTIYKQLIDLKERYGQKMILKYISLALFLQFTFVTCVCCGKLNNDHTAENENSTSSIFSARKARATYDFVYADLIGCTVQSDPSCLVNVAENFLSVKKNELLGKFLLSTSLKKS